MQLCQSHEYDPHALLLTIEGDPVADEDLELEWRIGGDVNGRKTMSMAPPTEPRDVPEPTLRMILSILDREQSGAIPTKSAQLAVTQIFPALDPVEVVPPFNLDDVPEPSTPATYDRAMGMIWRAAVEGRVSLDDADRAMNLTMARFRARLKTARG